MIEVKWCNFQIQFTGKIIHRNQQAVIIGLLLKCIGMIIRVEEHICSNKHYMILFKRSKPWSILGDDKQIFSGKCTKYN